MKAHHLFDERGQQRTITAHGPVHFLMLHQAQDGAGDDALGGGRGGKPEESDQAAQLCLDQQTLAFVSKCLEQRGPVRDAVQDLDEGGSGADIVAW